MKLTSLKNSFAAIACFFITVWVSQPAFAQDFMQKGNTITETNQPTNSGLSVSMPDANTIAIGAPYSDSGIGIGQERGRTRVYQWDGNAWGQKGTDIDGIDSYSQAGRAVSMPDANTIAIGAPGEGQNNFDQGHVLIYRWNGTDWEQKGSEIYGENIWDEFGNAVSMPDSNTLAVGCHYYDASASQVQIGFVKVYNWDGSTWVQRANTITGDAAYDRGGFSVNMSDSLTVAYGAPLNDGNGTDAGNVRVRRLTYNPQNSLWYWAIKGADLDGEAAGDNFGHSVSLADSNTVAIGAPNNDGNGNNAGHVRVFRWSGSDWVQKGIDIDGEEAGDQSGWSVSMPDSNTVAIGSIWGETPSYGHVRVFGWNGSAWVQKGMDIVGTANFARWGYTVSMPDTSTVGISSRLHSGVFHYGCQASTSSFSATVCDNYVSPSGNHTWTATGIYADTIPNATGCDSIMTIDLTVNTVDVSVTNTAPSLMANATGAMYQWLDCDNSYAELTGESGQTYTSFANGNFAVEVTQNNCVDTSSCEAVLNISILGSGNGEVMAYPSPTEGDLSIDLGQTYQTVQILVRNALGQMVGSQEFNLVDRAQITLTGDPGAYFVEVHANGIRQAVLHLVKK